MPELELAQKHGCDKVSHVGNGLFTGCLCPGAGESRAGQEAWRQEQATWPQTSNRLSLRQLPMQGLPCLPNHSRERAPGNWGHVVGKEYLPTGDYTVVELEN